MDKVVPPARSFRLEMLLYDTRYRSLTIQVVALAGLMLLFAWLVSNTITNLAVLGKPVSFSFLGQPSSYDINQTLIEYSSRSSHLRASMIGLMNTVLVAVMGCVLATILGVFIGILRISRNWIVARLMTIYIEGFRNVPVLLWIVFFMAVIIETLPAPRAFRGDDATASMLFGDSVAITNRGVFIPEPLFSNSLGDIPVFGAFFISIDLLVITLVTIGGIYAARRVGRWAAKEQQVKGERPTTWHMQTLLVAGPPALVLWFLGFHLGFPELKGFNFAGGIHMRNSLIALWLALSCYTAAFIAEIVRAGIMSVSKGQTEASLSLGAEARAVDAPDHSASGPPCHHSTADLPVPESYQEFVAGHCRGLHGCHGDAWRNHA